MITIKLKPSAIGIRLMNFTHWWEIDGAGVRKNSGHKRSCRWSKQDCDSCWCHCSNIQVEKIRSRLIKQKKQSAVCIVFWIPSEFLNDYTKAEHWLALHYAHGAVWTQATVRLKTTKVRRIKTLSWYLVTASYVFITAIRFRCAMAKELNAWLLGECMHLSKSTPKARYR